MKVPSNRKHVSKAREQPKRQSMIIVEPPGLLLFPAKDIKGKY